jgi:hypothetical protein
MNRGSIRRIQTIDRMIQTGNFKSAQKIADEFGVSRRTIRPVSILFAGIHDTGEIIRAILQDKIGEHSITVEFANSDKTLWWIEEITTSLKKSHYDLCILWLNNIVSLRQGVQPSGIENRMESVCKLINDLTSNTTTKVMGLIGGQDDNYWAERAINSGAQVVYHAPFLLKRFVNDFPVVMGWATRKDFERIIQVNS